MKTLRKTTLLTVILSLFTILSCDQLARDLEECEECKDAQEHYYQALINNNCDYSITHSAEIKLIGSCKNGSYKVSYIQEAACIYYYSPTYDCN